MTPRNDVELRVEELVLHGFAPGDRHRIGDAAGQELSRLLAEQGVPPALSRGGEIRHLHGGTFEVRPELGAEAIGVRIAHAVYEGLRR